MKQIKFTLDGERHIGKMYPSGAITYQVCAETWETHRSEVSDIVDFVRPFRKIRPEHNLVYEMMD